MKKVYTAAFLVGFSLFFGFIYLFTSNADFFDDFSLGVQNQSYEDVQERIEEKGMDQLLAEDLSMTTSMFISQLSLQLNRWAEADLSSPELKKRFQEELNEHDHFESFAIVQNGKISKSIPNNQITEDKIKTLVHETPNVVFSDPYQEGNNQYFLMAETKENGKTVVGEIDLKFVKHFITDMAAVADANGNFFVSGNNPDIEWKTTNELPSTVTTQNVPELGWQIAVQSEGDDVEEKPFYKGQAVIKFEKNTNAIDWIEKKKGIKLVKNTSPYYVIKSDNQTTESLLQTLREDPKVDFAEPNYIFTKQAKNTLPNDEFFAPYQWNLTQVEVEKGWEYTGGTEEVIIAVLDTGVDSGHQDLEAKVLKGFNAFDGSDNVHDTHGHGTHVAGIAAAITNNVTGIAGVAQKNKILPIKVLNENGEGSSFEVAQGIRWAVDQGASIINMSLGDYYNSRVLKDAIRYAYNQDVVLIAASGNDNVGDPMYPADYKEVLTVGAVNDQRERSFFSNYGRHIDVTAPGEHIPSTFPNDFYVIMSGTSMAAPHVAGLAGLIRSINPDLSNEEVYTIIRKTSIDLGRKGPDAFYGYGEINISNALKETLSQ